MTLADCIAQLSALSERELAARAQQEFQALANAGEDEPLRYGHVKHSLALLAFALGWVDRPRVYTRVVTDGVRMSDRIG